MKQIIKSVLPASVLNKFHDLKRKRKIKKKFSGNAVYCPICKSSFSVFGEFGPTNRENTRCHSCGSLERHRLIFLYLTKKFNLFDDTVKPLKLLHFAPEKTFYDKFSNNPAIDYTPCDLFPEIYQFEGDIKILKVDITSIPFEAEYFDLILCSHVLEHVPNDKQAMSELYRVLSKDGSGIFQVPIDYNRTETYEDWSIISPEEREKAFGQKDHVRWYGQDYKTRLKSVGFMVNEDDYVTKFSEDEIFKYGLVPTELIYCCTK